MGRNKWPSSACNRKIIGFTDVSAQKKGLSSQRVVHSIRRCEWGKGYTFSYAIEFSMLNGWFEGASDAPFLEGRVSFPRPRIRSRISFLADTGADGTVIMPSDSQSLGIDFGALRYPTTS